MKELWVLALQVDRFDVGTGLWLLDCGESARAASKQAGVDCEAFKLLADNDFDSVFEVVPVLYELASRIGEKVMDTHAVRLRFGAFGGFGLLIVEGAVFLATKLARLMVTRCSYCCQYKSRRGSDNEVEVLC